MAPKGGRGGGGRGGSGGVSTCPGAFSSEMEQVFFANDVLFLAAYLGLGIALCSVRKKSGPGKKLIGIPFSLSILFFIITYALSVISTVLSQCDTITIYDYYNWQIPLVIFSSLGNWLLLFVVVYTLNAMLREHLGQFTAVFKLACLAIVGIMGALTCGLIGIVSYNRWTQTEAGQDQDATLLVDSERNLRIAYWVLYLLSVLVAGALALLTVFQLRSRRDRGGDLIGWSIALTIVMVLWIVMTIVFAATSLQDWLTYTAQAVLAYLSNFFGWLSFVFLLCIAKHSCWGNRTVVEQHGLPDPHAAKTEQQYAYNAHPNGQQYAYNGAQPNANGHYYYQQVAGNNAPEVVR